MATKGIWVLSNVYLKQVTGQWVTAAYVPPAPQVSGWVAGGGSNISRIDRIVYASDTGTASVRGSLSTGRGQTASTGNDNYGWVGGGTGPRSLVDRITYSDDTVATIVRGPLTYASQGRAGTGNIDYGWFGGGSFASPGFTSLYATTRVDRVDYSNDVAAAVSLGNVLSITRRSATAIGNANYGWFCGGLTPTNLSSVDRIDFSNDQVVASVRGPLTSARNGTGSAGNADYGWIVEGVAPSGPSVAVVSTIDRITYANDTATATFRGGSGAFRNTLGDTGSESFGWFGGGYSSTGPLSSVVMRITYSSDTGSLQRGPLSLARASVSSVGGFPG